MTKLPQRRQTLQQTLNISERVHLRILLSRPHRLVRLDITEIQTWYAESGTSEIKVGCFGRAGGDVVDWFVEYRIVRRSKGEGGEIALQL